MGDRIRRLSRQLLKIIFQASTPALIIYAILIGSLVLRGSEAINQLPPIVYLRLLEICYVTAFIAAAILEFRALQQSVLRADAKLIGRNFGGFRRQDRRFCDGMEAYAKDDTRNALELFLAVQEYDLTESETGVLSFYIGRCYQILGCPSNAVPYYEKARKNGFSREFALLFEARAQAEGGAFDESYAAFRDLLDHDPPFEFYFLCTDIGFLFVRQKKPEEAAVWFERSIAEHKNFAFALSGMAIVSLQRGDFAAAQDYHYKALVNHLKDPASFRRYYEETKALMLEEHPEWAERAKVQNAPAES